MPPVVKLCERLMLDVELAVRSFPRYHRYATGTRLRNVAFDLTRAAHRAWRERSSDPSHIHALEQRVDDVRITLQLGSQLRAFNSFGQFESLARTAHEIGRQVGGWNKATHPKGQNATGRSVPQQRAQTLSTDGASAGANR